MSSSVEQPEPVTVKESRSEAVRRRLVFGSAQYTSHSDGVRRIGFVERGLLNIAGVDVGTMAVCPWEAPRYVTLGASVLLSSFLSSVALYYALRDGLRAPSGAVILLALVWGFFLLAVDRFVGADFSNRALVKRVRMLSAIAILAPRALIGALLSVVFSTGLVLNLFSAEINSTIIVDRSAALAEANSRVSTLQVQVDGLERQYLQEVSGIAGSGSPGIGERARQIQAQLNAVQGELAASQAQVRGIAAQQVDSGSLLARTGALDTLTKQSPQIAYLYWILNLIIALVIDMPVILTFLQSTRVDGYRIAIAGRVQWLELRIAEEYESRRGGSSP